VVATRTEGAQEVVDDQVTGLLVNIGNIEELSSAIVRLLEDAELRRNMGEQSQAVAKMRFGLERMVDEIEKVYLES
jgi:glycosyltransferase involved in cell wall biosynthesis